MCRHVTEKRLRTAYFFGFTTACMSAGLLGTALGYTMASEMPGLIARALCS